MLLAIHYANVNLTLLANKLNGKDRIITTSVLLKDKTTEPGTAF